jgi:hypothetical protein
MNHTTRLYTYHLGMVENPLPFERFRTKKQTLDNHLKADMDGKDEWRTPIIDKLCLELGY